MTEPSLEDLDVEQLRTLARIQAKKIVEREIQMRALAQHKLIEANGPLMASFLGVLLSHWTQGGVIRLTDDVVNAAPQQVRWAKTPDGYVIWTERLPPPPKPPGG